MRSSMPFRPRDEAQEKAIKQYMEENGLIQSEALRTLIDKALNIEKRYAPREDACTFQYYLGESEAPTKTGKGWYCLEKSPNAKLLGSGTIEAADKFCEACKSKINLEERWKERITKPLEEYTYCKEGGMVDNKTKRIQCRETDKHGKRLWHDMEKCFTYFKGGRCPSLKTLPKRQVKKTGITRRRRQ